MEEVELSLRITLLEDTLSKELKGIMKAFGTEGRDKTLSAVGSRFLEMGQSTFGAGRSWWRGNKWEPYSKGYAKYVGSSTPTLLRTGRLRNSLKMSPPRGGTVTIYSNLKYAGEQFIGNKKTGRPGRYYFPVESKGAALWRLNYKAEKVLVELMGRTFMKLSRGALSLPNVPTTAGTYSIGNPLRGE